MVLTNRTRQGLAALGVVALAVGAGFALGDTRAAAPADRAPDLRAALLNAPSVLQVPGRRARQASLEEARGLSDAFTAIARSLTPAVVRIETERTIPDPHADVSSQRFRDFFGIPEGEDVPMLYPEVTGGSGFLVSPDGVILTNNHVVEAAEKIVVTLWDKRTYDAELVGSDPTTDVAVVRIRGDDLPAASLGDSDRAEVGQWVLAIGNPGFSSFSTLDFTVTSGILSAKGRPLDIIRRELQASRNPAAVYAIEDFLQTDAVINPGNSGGPLVDLDGNVIGINTAIASETGYYQGYGFAIPINVARRVMDDLVRHGRVRRALLGINIDNVGAEDAEVYRLPDVSGVLVQDFAEDSPSRRAGIRRHDVIVAVDGSKVERVAQLQRVIAQRRPGEAVEITAIRYGTPVTFSVELTEAPDFGDAGAAAPAPHRPEGLGLEFADLTTRLARQLGYDHAGGVVISSVEPTSPALRKNVRPQYRVLEINRQRVETAGEAETLVAAARSGDVLSFLLEDRFGSTLIANVRVP